MLQEASTIFSLWYELDELTLIPQLGLAPHTMEQGDLLGCEFVLSSCYYCYYQHFSFSLPRWLTTVCLEFWTPWPGSQEVSMAFVYCRVINGSSRPDRGGPPP